MIEHARTVYPQTLAFYQRALEETRLAEEIGAMGPIARAAAKNVRALNITGAYLATPASLEEVGDAYGGLTRERVR